MTVMAQLLSLFPSTTASGYRIVMIAATVLTALILIASLPVTAIFFAHYILAVLLASNLRPDLSVASSLDAWFATDPIYNHPYGTIVWHLICEGSISVEELREKFRERVLNCKDPENGHFLYRRLCHRLTTFLGYFFWEPDEDFDLHHHIRLYDYHDEPGLSLASSLAGPCCTEGNLFRVTGKLLTRAFKAGTSPWELLLIPNYKPSTDESRSLEPKTVLCLRIHHSLGDMFSISAFMARFFELQLPLERGNSTPAERSLLFTVWKEITDVLWIPHSLARSIVEGGDGRNAWNPGRKKLTGELVSFCSGRIPWEYFRAIMHKYRVSPNAAVYAVVTGALVRLMSGAGREVPKSAIATMFPYPKPNHPEGLVNHAVGSFFTFNPTIHSGARLVQHVGKQVRRVREGDRVADMIGRLQPITVLFPAWLWHAIARRPRTPTLLLTNFIGPQETLETCGIRLVDSIGCMGPDPATGIYGAMVSTLGKVRIVLNVDRRILGGMERLIAEDDFSKHVHNEIKYLIMNDGLHTDTTLKDGRKEVKQL